MTAVADTPAPRGFARVYAWDRVKPVLFVCLALFLMLVWGWKVSYAVLVGRILFIGMVLLLVFGVLERWPERLPRWLARWALQVAGIAIAAPFVVAIAYWATTFGLPEPWYKDKERMEGYSAFTMFCLLFGPWIAVTALFRQISGEAQRQALAFDLARSELERGALDARMRVLQAQVEPHFLFNTLANVRELVDSGSPQASEVLGSLISYLRAAVPRLHEAGATLAQELELVRAYLEVMHMRMPDRLRYTLHADDAALRMQCPPMTLLTPVENAVRHGIDPSEEGGHIDVRVRVEGDRCRAEVTDTGVGLREGSETSGTGLGTGLANLRERLQLTFSDDATMEVTAVAPHGVRVMLTFPARAAIP